MIGSPRRAIATVATVATVAVAMVAGPLATTGAANGGYLTSEPPMVTLDPAVAGAGGELLPIINSGEWVDGFQFSGIPDGIGAMPGPWPGSVDVFVNHEESHVPFLAQADFQDSSVSKLTLDSSTGEILAASIPLGPDAGFIRFCSATMAGPPEGLSDYVFLTGEESNDILDVPTGAVYGPDPALSGQRQAGFAVVLDPDSGEYEAVTGMGRHNHENSMVVPGGWDQIAVISGDDTFSAPSSQLYLYLTGSEQGLWSDTGSLWAFRVTHTDEGKVDAADPFNDANDYGDIAAGEEWQGRFIRVPRKIAMGATQDPPQTALENWSNANNVFQFIRIEDTAYNPNDPHVVYLADTGERRAIPDDQFPAEQQTGRLHRGSSSGPFGPYGNGRIFQMEFHPDNPKRVTSFSILHDADAGGPNNPAAMHQPDNMGTSENSLMVQEDSGQAPNSRVWRYDFAAETWSVVASVNDSDWESSGIVDASEWFGPGWWLLDVQAHGADDWVRSEVVNGVTFKQEGGQLLLMKVPGS